MSDVSTPDLAPAIATHFRASARELDHLINVALDQFGDLEPRDVVVQTVQNLDDHALKKISTPTLLRMTTIMARHADECAGLGVSLDADDLNAGYALARSLQIPDTFSKQLHRFQDRMTEKLDAYHFFDRDMNAKITKRQIQNFSERFLKDFTQSFEMHNVPALCLYNDPHDKAFGACAFDPKTRAVSVEINTAHYKTMRDLPKLVITLGHEAMHAYAGAVTQNQANLNYFSNDWRAHMTMLSVFNKQFYTAQRADVYFKHLEEHLAEATGLTLAVRAIKRMGLPIDVKDFQQSLAYFSSAAVAYVLKQEKLMPAALKINPKFDRI